MGIERFEYDGEDPRQEANEGPRYDTGRSGNTGRSEVPGRSEDAGRAEDAGHSGDTAPSEDAGRSEEVPQSRDARRSEDAAPDHSPRESSETVDTETKRAEPRTRNEYADHVRRPGPIEGDPPENDAKEPSDSGREHPETTQPKEQRSGKSSDEVQRPESSTRIPSNSERADEEPPSPGEAPAVPPYPADGKPDDEDLQVTQPGRELNSDADDPESDDDKREAREKTTNDVRSTDSQDEEIGGSYKDATFAKDQPRPLTDREWTEHLDQVRDGLDKAREGGLLTTRLHTIDGKGQVWAEERELLHESILEGFYAKAADVPCDFKAIMAGGLGGAGKSTVLTGQAGIDLTQYLTINPDDFKEEMARRGMLPEIEGLSPMEASDLAHEESSYLALQLALRAQAEGKNVIWDITMSTEKSTESRINDLRNAGYDHIEGLFVEIPVETSVVRTESRHRQGHEMYRIGEGLGGRYVPPEVIKSQEDPEWGSQNKKTFETLKGRFDEWSIYDNSPDGLPATLIDSSRMKHAG